ncbi:MAG: hypothetical protein CM15mV18_1010 [uncultured marine virus]|nr:MAG: hypothetical protein CM15mV18_1010 [uncultured marine virus]
MLRYLKKKYDLQTIGFYLVSKYRELQYQLRDLYKKEMLVEKCLLKTNLLLIIVLLMMFTFMSILALE